METPAKVSDVLLTHGGNGNGNAREVDALVVRHGAGNLDHGLDVGVGHLDDANADLAVVNEKRIAWAAVAGQPLEGRAHTFLRAENVVRGDREDVANREFVGAVLELAEADLRALEVHENCDVLTEILGSLADIGVHSFVIRVSAVAEVHAGDVHARLDKRADLLIRIRCRSQCAHNFCFTHVYPSVALKGGTHALCVLGSERTGARVASPRSTSHLTIK